MAWFKFFLRGEDFPGELIGERHPIGFFVNRFVEASNADEAEALVVAGLQADPELQLPEGVRLRKPASVYFEEVLELAPHMHPPQPQAFVWFVDHA